MSEEENDFEYKNDFPDRFYNPFNLPDLFIPIFRLQVWRDTVATIFRKDERGPAADLHRKIGNVEYKNRDEHLDAHGNRKTQDGNVQDDPNVPCAVVSHAELNRWRNMSEKIMVDGRTQLAGVLLRRIKKILNEN